MCTARPRYFVAPHVKPGDSISWRDLQDSEIVSWYEDGEPYFAGSSICHQVRCSAPGIPFTPIPYCSFGDYDNSTAVERSNARTMLEQFPWLVTVTGDYGSQMIGYLGREVHQNPALIEAINALDSYPVADESDLSELESELEREGWLDWGRSDFRRDLGTVLDAIDPGSEHDPDELTDSDLDGLWSRGSDVFNVNGGTGYKIECGGGVWFYIDEWIKRATECARDDENTPIWCVLHDLAIKSRTE